MQLSFEFDVQVIIIIAYIFLAWGFCCMKFWEKLASYRWNISAIFVTTQWLTIYTQVTVIKCYSSDPVILCSSDLSFKCCTLFISLLLSRTIKVLDLNTCTKIYWNTGFAHKLSPVSIMQLTATLKILKFTLKRVRECGSLLGCHWWTGSVTNL